jgi:hypothetical protein
MAGAGVDPLFRFSSHHSLMVRKGDLTMIRNSHPVFTTTKTATKSGKMLSDPYRSQF